MGACACLGGRGGWRWLHAPCKDNATRTRAGPALDGGPRAAWAQRHPGGRVRGAARTASEPDPLHARTRTPCARLCSCLQARCGPCCLRAHLPPQPPPTRPRACAGWAWARRCRSSPWSATWSRPRAPRRPSSSPRPPRCCQTGRRSSRRGRPRCASCSTRWGRARGPPGGGGLRSLLGCWAQLLRCALPAGLCVCTYKRGARRRVQTQARAMPPTHPTGECGGARGGVLQAGARCGGWARLGGGQSLTPACAAAPTKPPLPPTLPPTRPALPAPSTNPSTFSHANA